MSLLEHKIHDSLLVLLSQYKNKECDPGQEGFEEAPLTAVIANEFVCRIKVNTIKVCPY